MAQSGNPCDGWKGGGEYTEVTCMAESSAKSVQRSSSKVSHSEWSRDDWFRIIHQTKGSSVGLTA